MKDFRLTAAAENVSPDDSASIRDFVEHVYNLLQPELLGFAKDCLTKNPSLKRVRSGEEEDIVQQTFEQFCVFLNQNEKYPKNTQEWRALIFCIASRQFTPFFRSNKRKVKVSGETGMGESPHNDRRPLDSIPFEDVLSDYSKLFEVLDSFGRGDQEILREDLLSRSNSATIVEKFGITLRYLQSLRKEFDVRFNAKPATESP